MFLWYFIVESNLFVAIKQALKGCHAEGIYIFQSWTAGNGKITKMLEVTLHFLLISAPAALYIKMIYYIQCQTGRVFQYWVGSGIGQNTG